MPKAGAIPLLGTSTEFRIVSDWLAQSSIKKASWLVSQEAIDSRDALLVELREQLAKAGQSKRGRRYIQIRKEHAEAFVSIAAPYYPLFGTDQPRSVRRVFKRIRHRLRRKPGPERRAEPRVPTPDEGSTFRTGRQKEYRRRVRQREEIRAMVESGETALGSAIKKLR